MSSTQSTIPSLQTRKKTREKWQIKKFTESFVLFCVYSSRAKTKLYLQPQPYLVGKSTFESSSNKSNILQKIQDPIFTII